MKQAIAVVEIASSRKPIATSWKWVSSGLYSFRERRLEDMHQKFEGILLTTYLVVQTSDATLRDNASQTHDAAVSNTPDLYGDAPEWLDAFLSSL